MEALISNSMTDFFQKKKNLYFKLKNLALLF